MAPAEMGICQKRHRAVRVCAHDVAYVAADYFKADGLIILTH